MTSNCLNLLANSGVTFTATGSKKWSFRAFGSKHPCDAVDFKGIFRFPYGWKKAYFRLFVIKKSHLKRIKRKKGEKMIAETCSLQDVESVFLSLSTPSTKREAEARYLAALWSSWTYCHREDYYVSPETALARVSGWALYRRDSQDPVALPVPPLGSNFLRIPAPVRGALILAAVSLAKAWSLQQQAYKAREEAVQAINQAVQGSDPKASDDALDALFGSAA